MLETLKERNLLECLREDTRAVGLVKLILKTSDECG